MTVTKPGKLPARPYFSSGPCAKPPGWDASKLKTASLGRSHRAKIGKARLQLAIDLTREVLQVPDTHRIGIVPGSDTGAVEMALWSMLGARGVTMLAWESFGEGWVTDVAKQLKLDATRLAAPYGEIPDLSAVDWAALIAPEGTLWVDAQVRDSALTHSLFVSQRTKDAVVDQLLARTGRRPSVERESPGLCLHVHVFSDRATLSVDTSGDSLHKRGWRRAQGRAPLAETLAAGIVALSGWESRGPLLDPFAGSGTLVIEAGLMAARKTPSALGSFLFKRGVWLIVIELVIVSTAWSFAPEVCLLMGAQLALSRRLLARLVVKPGNMLRNLDRSGGVVLSEAVMMALAPRMGRDRAHALVLEIAREARRDEAPFAGVVRAHPDVRRHLKPREIEAALQYRNSLGLASFFVDEVLNLHQKELGRARRTKKARRPKPARPRRTAR